jgi:hypothetical protein
VLVVVLAVGDLSSAASKIPQGDTTKRRAILVLADEVLHGLGGDETRAGQGSRRAGKQTNEELGVLALVALGEQVGPGVVVEAVAGQSRISNGIANGVVVELHKQSVQGGSLDEVLQVKVWVEGGALGSGGQEHGAIQFTELLSHANVRLVV